MDHKEAEGSRRRGISTPAMTHAHRWLDESGYRWTRTRRNRRPAQSDEEGWRTRIKRKGKKGMGGHAGMQAQQIERAKRQQKSEAPRKPGEDDDADADEDDGG
jgi:hypothetical protein